MEQHATGLEASTATKGFRYARHCPEQTLLYQLVERYYSELAELMIDQGRPLPRYVRREIDVETCDECGGVIKVIACLRDLQYRHKLVSTLFQKCCLMR